MSCPSSSPAFLIHIWPTVEIVPGLVLGYTQAKPLLSTPPRCPLLPPRALPEATPVTFYRGFSLPPASLQFFNARLTKHV